MEAGHSVRSPVLTKRGARKWEVDGKAVCAAWIGCMGKRGLLESKWKNMGMAQTRESSSLGSHEGFSRCCLQIMTHARSSRL